MTPLIAPIGLDYIATYLRKAGIQTEILDLPLSQNPDKTLKNYFENNNPDLIGLSLRNADDCYWPKAQWFVPKLADTVKTIRKLIDAPIVIGGVGFSIFAERIVKYTGADFGIRGDGEAAMLSLVLELNNKKKFKNVPGLIFSENAKIRTNPPAWQTPDFDRAQPNVLSLPTNRDAFDNLTYFQKGGQLGLETKRGCNQHCIYCADPLAKGKKVRTREPAEVAEEAEQLLAQGIDVLHLCDSEFNIPRRHAVAVCDEFIKRSLGEKIRWYAYLTTLPFDDELAEKMKKAGCIGIDFTGDSASEIMLRTYRQNHRKQDLASAVKLSRKYNIKVMIDLLLGGPGETPDTLAETINFIKNINPDCAGAALGIRIYAGTEMAHIVNSQGPTQQNPNILRKYDGPVDFFKPTFYISENIGQNPAQIIRDMIKGDKRFFEPDLEQPSVDDISRDHNYNDNEMLTNAISKGARGAYWHILRNLRDS